MARPEEQETGQRAIRAFRQTMRLLENPLASLFVTLQGTETTLADLEIDLPLVNFSPFGSLSTGSNSAQDAPATEQRVNGMAQIAAHPLPTVTPNSQASPGIMAKHLPETTIPSASGANLPQPAPVFSVRRPQRPNASGTDKTEIRAVGQATNLTPGQTRMDSPVQGQEPSSASNAVTDSFARLSRLADESYKTVLPAQAQASVPPAQIASQHVLLPSGFSGSVAAGTGQMAEVESQLPAQTREAPGRLTLALIESLANDLLASPVQKQETMPRTVAPPDPIAADHANNSAALLWPISPQRTTGEFEQANRLAPQHPTPSWHEDTPLSDQTMTRFPDARTLAMWINEVLVEEASRHGIDLS